MTNAWFSPEFADSLRWLSFLSLLSLLAVYPLRGRHRTAMHAIWTAALAVGVLCLGAMALGVVAGQPRFVIGPLAAIGVALSVAFGGTFAALRSAYREAELRRSIAQDL